MTKPPSIGVAQLTSHGLSIQGQTGAHTPADLPLGPVSDVRGLYVHVPFCFHKCHYCDFYSIVDQKDRQKPFADRLCNELAAASRRISGPLQCIFVGGGTPTLLGSMHWQALLDTLHREFEFADDLEFTVEANPETVTAALLDVLAAGGVNRISIGAQSFDVRLLKALERWHEPDNVGRCVELARQAGIGNISLDLIFAIPGESIEQWATDLDTALALEPTHLSCYGLMYEPNTPLTRRLQRGDVQRIDDDLEAAMYEHAIDRLEREGFEHYEISNWARNGRRCGHNMLYWTNANWWACGPGGAAHINGWRWKNIPRLDSYIAGEGLSPVQDIEHLDDDARIGEMLLLRMRLLEGIPTRQLDELLNASPGGPLRRASIEHNLDAGLLQLRDATIRLTRRGLLLADSVIAELL